MLDIATDRSAEARILVIHLRGRIDALSAREFDEFFEDLLRGGERFFILRGNHLEAISSAGIGSLVKFVRRLRGLGGGAVFVGLPEEIRLLLEFFGLGELLPAYAKLEDARAALESSLVRFQDKLEIKRESTLRTRVHPDRNHRNARAAMRSYQKRQGSGRLHSELGTAHAREEASRTETPDASPDLRRLPAGAQASSGPTESELEIMSQSGPTESELEVMAASGPTESELEVMAASGPTESELEVMSAGAPTASGRALRSESGTNPRTSGLYEQAVLETELAREAEDADADDEFERLRAAGQPDVDGDQSGQPWIEAKVMGCEQCGLNLRIVNFGLHMCPACGIEFDVRRDGNVSFYEKL